MPVRRQASMALSNSAGLVMVLRVSRARVPLSSRATCAGGSTLIMALPLAVQCNGNSRPTAETATKRCVP